MLKKDKYDYQVKLGALANALVDNAKDNLTYNDIYSELNDISDAYFSLYKIGYAVDKNILVNGKRFVDTIIEHLYNKYANTDDITLAETLKDAQNIARQAIDLNPNLNRKIISLEAYAYNGCIGITSEVVFNAQFNNPDQVHDAIVKEIMPTHITNSSKSNPLNESKKFNHTLLK